MTDFRRLTKRLSFTLSLILISLGLMLVFYIRSLTHLITAKFEGPKWALPSQVYADSLKLYAGFNIRDIHLKQRLDQLGYRQVTDAVTRPGEYQIETEADKARWIIFLHDFEYPLHSFKGILVRFDVSNDIIIKTEYRPTREDDFEELPLIELEPELITEFFENAREDRQIVTLDQVPANLLNAIIAVEDQRFLDHSGIDPKGIVRAFLSNLRAGSITQGGSTITQQLVRNFFLTQKKSYIRKAVEAMMAFIVESRYSKDAILEAYVNEIYFGQRGSTGIFGAAEAARFYFAKPVEALTLAECAMLAGIIRGPGVYSPFKNSQKAIERRNTVLREMLEAKVILRQEYLEALEEPLRPRNIAISRNIAPYFVDFVRQELLERYPKKILNTQGLRIFTTLDVLLQNFARRAVTTTLIELESRFAHLKPSPDDQQAPSPLQGAFVSIQPQTGYVRALVGGRDYNESQFNRIIQAHRQPGSLFKPLIVLAAFTKGDGRQFKLTDRLINKPFQWKYDGQIWEPKNYEEETDKEEVSLREAIEHSINIPMARLASKVGIRRIAKLAQRLGIQKGLPVVPSLSLGSVEVTPLEMALVYAVLANGGVRAMPISIKYVVDQKKRVLESQTVEIKKVVSEEASFMVTYALEGVINYGTAKDVRLFGYTGPAAGKTGTTNEYLDAWFAGYTPDLVGVAWVGYDKEKPVGLPGAQAALPIWARFMMQAARDDSPRTFIVPESVVFRTIDPQTGFLAVPECPQTIEEAFIRTTEPKTTCPLHGPSSKKLKKIERPR